MKNGKWKIGFFCSLMLIPLAFAIGQNSFEGKIILKTENREAKEKAEVTWYVKGAKHRMDFKATSEKGTMEYTVLSIDGEAKLIADGENGRSVIPIPKESLSKPTTEMNIIHSEKLNKEKINGFECEKYLVESEQKTTEYWVTDETPISADALPGFMKKHLTKALPQLTFSSFPVKITTKDKEGNLLMLQEFTEFIPMKVDDSVFEME